MKSWKAPNLRLVLDRAEDEAFMDEERAVAPHFDLDVKSSTLEKQSLPKVFLNSFDHQQQHMDILSPTVPRPFIHMKVFYVPHLFLY